LNALKAHNLRRFEDISYSLNDIKGKKLLR